MVGLALALLIGGLAGATAAWAALRARIASLATVARHVAESREAAARLETALEHERRAATEKLQLVERAREELSNAFKALSADALKHNNSSFLELAKSQLEQFQIKARGDLEQREKAVQHLVDPIRLSLERFDGQLRELEKARTEAYGSLNGQVRTLAEGQERLRQETGNLVTALRAPHVRGRWGEVQLKRVIELTGMIEHCDFVLQSTVRDADGALLRPDLIVHLPGRKQVVVDAKVPLAAYLDACEESEEGIRTQRLTEHARQVRNHVGKLSAKAYFRQFDPTPDFVVMFVPDETFLRVAHEHDSVIGEDAWRANVILASPTNLFALLRTIAAVWQQETVAESARQIHGLGQELHERLATMASHFNQLGKSLTGAIGQYNKTVGALESRVLVTARKLETHAIAGEIAELATVDVQPRALSSPELLEVPELPLELPTRAADAA